MMHIAILTITQAFTFYSKHKYRDTFGDAYIQYHDFDNGDAYVYKDKYTALLHQELQNPNWCLHDPIPTQNYQISSDMDIETMAHAMYFDGNASTVTKINQVPYQTIQYNDKGMFPAQLMDDTPIQVFIDNGTTPSILPLSTYKKHPILVLVCNSQCPYDILLGRTSLAHLSTWQDYANSKLYVQQISIPIVAKNNVRILPGNTRIILAAFKTGKTIFTPRNTIMGKGIAYV